MPKAPAPTRATNSLTIAWGLVTVPVKLYTGTQDSGIKRSQFTADGRPVGKADVAKNEDGTYDLKGGTVDRDSIVKRFLTDEGVQVDLSDGDIAFAAGFDKDSAATVIATHPLDLLGDYFVEAHDQVRADKVAAKTLSMMLTALRMEKAFALIKYAARGNVRFAALTPEGEWLRLHYTEEIREALPMPPEVDVDDPTMQLARDLVQAFMEPGSFDLVDETSAKVRAFATEKAKAGFAPPTSKVEAKTEQAIDLMATLKASVEKAGRKPAKKAASKRQEKVPA